MNAKIKRNAAVLIVAAIAVAVFAAILHFSGSRTDAAEGTGQIYLYGEKHSDERILEQELELWKTYYHENGMRHLFVEYPYYTAEFLNLWMKSENDDILNQIYEDWAGTLAQSEEVLDFYRQIKADCPETVFHGTDVGHQYETTGARYLAYLQDSGQEGSESYRQAELIIGQGRHYYQQCSEIYRENAMVTNFIREFDRLDGADIMGIYGAAHIWEEGDGGTGTPPSMAGQLQEHYGDALHTKDLSLMEEPYRVDTIQIGDKDYAASYFGKQDLSTALPQYQFREFWRIENAYDAFKDCLTNGNVLPYNNYPMRIEVGQVFVVDFTKTDGSVMRIYYRSDGNTWRGMPVTNEFLCGSAG